MAKTILAVDDSASIRQMVVFTLKSSGYEVTEAVDGQTALQVLADAPTPIDVVVLDYRLPDSNDLQLLSSIRRISPRSQVILMTAFGTPEVVKGAQQLGVFRVVDNEHGRRLHAPLVYRREVGGPPKGGRHVPMFRTWRPASAGPSWDGTCAPAGRGRRGPSARMACGRRDTPRAAERR